MKLNQQPYVEAIVVELYELPYVEEIVMINLNHYRYSNVSLGCARVLTVDITSSSPRGLYI